jgi:hypothetical protein
MPAELGVREDEKRVVAVKKTGGASSGLPVRVFISHKHDDKNAAKQILEALTKLGQDKLIAFRSEDIRAGDFRGWREALIEQLGLADILILLYTDPEENWDWCLYESGFFHGKHDRDTARRLIVLHDKATKPPHPLTFLETIEVSRKEPEAVKKLIYELFAKPPIPIRRDLTPDRLEGEGQVLLDAIIKAVCDPPTHKQFSKSIQIHIAEKDWSNAQEREVLQEATVFGNTKSLASLFLLDDTPGDGYYPWSKIYEQMKKMSDNASEWAVSLTDMMRNLVANQYLSTGLPLYRVPQGQQSAVYRPAVDSFRKRKGTLVFNVIFVELPTETTTEPADPSTALAHGLALGRMFRGGVLMPAKDDIEEVQHKLRRSEYTVSDGRKALAEVFHRLREKMGNVYVESRSRGFARSAIQGCFRDAERRRLDKIYKDWDAIYDGGRQGPGLKEMLVSLDGDQDNINLGKELDDASKLIAESLRINKDAMQLFAQKYSELVQEW